MDFFKSLLGGFSLFDFLDTKLIFIGIFGLVSGYFYLENGSLEKDLEIIKLKNLHLQGEISEAQKQIKAQNEAFENLRINKSEVKPSEALSALEKVAIETSNGEALAECEVNLKAFKELFRVLGEAK